MTKPELTTEADILQNYVEIKGNTPLRNDFLCQVPPDNSILYFSFSVYREQYIRTAAADYLTLFRLHRSLVAWRDLFDAFFIDDSIKVTIYVEYVEPILWTVVDKFIAIKDTFTAGAAKLSIIAKRGSEGCQHVQKKKPTYRYRQWNKELNDHHLNCSEYDRFDNARNRYFENVLEGKFKPNHGGRHHDIFPSIWMPQSLPRVEIIDGGVEAFSFETKRLSLEKEIISIEEAFPYAKELYESFYAYVHALSSSDVEPDF